METPSFTEDHISQIPALQLLQNMGYIYLTPMEADTQRGNKGSNVIMEDILTQHLRKINKIDFRGRQYEFSNSNISKAVQEIKNFPLKDGLIITNEKVYDLITLGKSFEENIQGEVKSFTLHYIDWTNLKNNVFHVTEEFPVQRISKTETYRPDLVLFVNGIPLVVIECKSPNVKTEEGKKPVDQAVSQQIRNQLFDDGIPQLYIYTQLLLGLAVSDGVYGTTGSSAEYWAHWKEEFQSKADEAKYNAPLSELKNAPLSKEQKDKLFSDRFKYVRQHFDKMEKNTIEVTEQDKILYNLCRPERLIELTFRFIIYENHVKKVPRYQQYFGVKKTVERVKYLENGKRKGGVIWHTQGSGKSLTMAMLAKSLALEPAIPNPKILLVTDRVDLDDQIYKTFKNCGKEVEQATTGNHLIDLLQDNKDHIITTVINKFEKAAKKEGVKIESPNIFILVDESHRTQYGALNVDMQRVFPNACFIGFTGTPIKHNDKDTVKKFGGMIHTYTIDQAVQDKAVVPLRYEGRHVVQEVNEKPLDAFFTMVSEPLTEYQRVDLKKKYAKADQLNEAEQKIWRTAYDISKHFQKEWQGTGFKGQLATPSKLAAIKYKEFFDEIGLIKTEVLISPPDTREGYEDIYKEPNERVVKFWKRIIEKYGNDKEYNKQVINSFKHAEEPEIIIVVDKLLTRFDAPKNVVLYIARNFKEHTLLQAIARVNRVSEGKDFGYIIDYYGVLGNLDEALETYSSLSEFDGEDLIGTLVNVKEEIAKLTERHSQVWDIFKGVKNKLDPEAYAIVLRDRDVRENFYERLSIFARTLKIALSTLEYVNNTPEKEVKRIVEDAKTFLKLRASVKSRYSDSIDYKQYEPLIQKLIDSHVSSGEIIQVTPLVNIFDKDAFAKELEKQDGAAARADLIASRTEKHISEKMEDDPAFYKKFSKMLEDIIEEHRLRRLLDVDFLKRVTEVKDSVLNKTGDDAPAKLRDNDKAKAFYGVTNEVLNKIGGKATPTKEIAADAGLKFDEIVLKKKLWIGFTIRTSLTK